MASKTLRFALFGNEYQVKKSAFICSILQHLRSRESKILIDKSYYEFLSQQISDELPVDGLFVGDDFEADFAMSIGGDGTFLKTASRVGAKETPIVGVNLGRLGFLADILPGEISEAIDELYDGKFKLESHTMLQVEADGEVIQGSPFALNDIAVLKRDEASMITVRTSVNDEYLMTYQADGLIVSTPTGSTAYNLSNGGPIVVPNTGTLCITSVAPHSLNIRPIVVRDDQTITLEIESRSHNYLVAVDGRSQNMSQQTRVHIHRAPFNANIVKRRNQRYFATLREKMMWGVDQRQNEINE